MGNADSHGVFVDGVKRVLEEDVAFSDAEFWNTLLSLPLSVEDVFEIISPTHVRQLLARRPKNLEAFLRRIAQKMDEISKKMEETPDASLPEPLLNYSNTCIRLLTRILPCLMEDAPAEETLKTILWKPGGLHVSTDAESSLGVPAAAVADGTSALDDAAAVADGTAGAADGTLAAAASIKDTFMYEPCGQEILRGIMQFLFLPGYTVRCRSADPKSPMGKPPTHRVDARVVWKGGVGVSKQLPVMPSQQYWRSRCEVLRCLLACLSGPLFQTSEDYQAKPPQWLSMFTGGDVAHTASLYCSLMSTVFTYDPVGWGMPYGGYFTNGTEEDLVDVSLQVLCIAMDFDPSERCFENPGESCTEAERDHLVPEGTRKIRNVYRYMLQNISKDEEIDMIFKGVVKMLSTVYQANQTVLPQSFRAVGFYQEALVLLWHLLTLNPSFISRVVKHLDTNQIVLPLLYLLQRSQRSQQLVGLLHTASFVLLVLSSERSFSVRLNEAYVNKVPLDVPAFQGNHADVVTLGLYKVISDHLVKPQSDALVEMLLTVLCNISSYIKSFALESCLKLLSLVDRCSRPGYLFRSDFTHHSLLFLLEFLANIIQYQYDGNSMLVYSVLRQKEVFERLGKLSLKDRVSSKKNTDEGSPEDESGQSWEPTEAWLTKVKDKMALQATMCMIDYLSSKVDKLCETVDVIEQDEVLNYLKTTTLVGILPVPHGITIRTYQASSYTSLWFTTYMWGVIFTRAQRMPLYDWEKIRLVQINQ